MLLQQLGVEDESQGSSFTFKSIIVESLLEEPLHLSPAD
jgi:hypothetical protein